ncbi:hypothetical protein [Spirochaeta africana]|uniref:Uncharacterized protein n=1 Tax=Spirochaeta africana (strain ATCC 700263 / DSM 8902 / Z-7692) TaxID=889378 RepID=H9UL38_SPIAZ|nr:hypothetical protein [Spirochaeta africana]AFG38231.1 hypothetical protein Spiaf_2195 [Spirochaeta africana DSM 8902]
MLQEFENVRQIAGEGKRRWFRDQEFDLIVWFDPDDADSITGFQLCYDKQGTERAVTWRRNQGFQHHRIDDGEEPYAPKRSPILVADGVFHAENTAARFRQAAEAIDPAIRNLVCARLAEYPAE